MPLAACFSVALLAWYAWYESGRRIYLAAFYIFLALGTLAKGPVALVLPAAIIFFFGAAKRDWRLALATLWIPGIALYLAVTLPWYIIVQLRNPEFFRVFILEHNLARFSEDVYHHHQPFWFYLPVFLLAMIPWTVALVMAAVESVRLIWRGRPAPKGADDLAGLAASLKRCPDTKRGLDDAGVDDAGVDEAGLDEGLDDAGLDEVSATGSNRGERIRSAFFGAKTSWALFLLIWMLVPILFFSVSQSKLPGYILPAVPAGALLVTEYLSARRGQDMKFSLMFAAAHGVLCGLLIFGSLSAASIAATRHLRWSSGSGTGAAIAGIFALGIAAALLSRSGVRLLSRVTALAVVVGVGVVIRFGAPVLDTTQSARPIAESIQAFSHEPVPLALFHVNRVQEYGLEFYLNRPAQKYEDGNVPAAAHVLVAAQGTQLQVAELVPGRRVSYLISVPAQKVDLYWVGKE
jgi:4-amino-4-deoxy-L-arabinose transferase-like glycosyltransferase